MIMRAAAQFRLELLLLFRRALPCLEKAEIAKLSQYGHCSLWVEHFFGYGLLVAQRVFVARRLFSAFFLDFFFTVYMLLKHCFFDLYATLLT